MRWTEERAKGGERAEVDGEDDIRVEAVAAERRDAAEQSEGAQALISFGSVGRRRGVKCAHLWTLSRTSALPATPVANSRHADLISRRPCTRGCGGAEALWRKQGTSTTPPGWEVEGQD